MEKVNTLVEEIRTLTNSLMEDAKSNASGNKAAGRRARKTTLALAKALKEYRSATIEADKAE